MERQVITSEHGLLFTEGEEKRDPVGGRYVYCEIAQTHGRHGCLITYPTYLLSVGGAKVYCRRLEVGAVQSVSSSRTAVLTGIRYYTPGGVKPSEAKKREATLKYLNDRLRRIKGNRRLDMTFGDHVAMFAEAVLLSAIIFPMPDGHLEILSVGEGATRIDQWLEAWKKRHTP